MKFLAPISRIQFFHLSVILYLHSSKIFFGMALAVGLQIKRQRLNDIRYLHTQRQLCAVAVPLKRIVKLMKKKKKLAIH